MSLAAAVKIIADDIERTVEEERSGESCLDRSDKSAREWGVLDYLWTCARQLRVALAASGEEQKVFKFGFDDQIDAALDAARRAREQQWPSEARRAADKLHGMLTGEDEHGERLVLCMDGPADGVTAPINPQMPDGARTALCGGVYQLRGNELHFDEAGTAAAVEREQSA